MKRIIRVYAFFYTFMTGADTVSSYAAFANFAVEGNPFLAAPTGAALALWPSLIIQGSSAAFFILLSAWATSQVGRPRLFWGGWAVCILVLFFRLALVVNNILFVIQ